MCFSPIDRCIHPLHKLTSFIIQHRRPRRSNTKLYNIFDAVGDILSGPKLEAEDALPYHPPFCDELSICDDGVRTFALKERPLSFTGEDFDIVEITNNNEEDFVRVRGAMLHLPGKDKMRMASSSSGRIS
ncbi:hypothetical protein QTG54_015213 [Skeletonema marinoi]|uniref:Uncharacterized protein n=1 Tax=Skeletonema marinoi TaxID=267567 RepID=A0AAD8XVE9_9STRA|nr:hypothetical protein QTG54_015213 [Skeletonema marinoi]